ncbi:MAG: lysozyme inhibitor LprI family protein [Chthoniobacterales bacterium]
MRLTVSLILAFSFVTTLKAMDWPKDYVVGEGTKSPDGVYGILMPEMNETTGGDPDNSPNYLVDVKKLRVIQKIDGVNYFRGQSHAGLAVTWSADSSFCVVEYDARFGFDSIFLLRREDNGFAQTDLGTTIQKSLDAATKKESHVTDAGYGCQGSVAVRIGKDHKILFRVISTTNPKELEEVKTYCAFFQGAYDPASGHWIVSNAHSVNKKIYDELSTSFFGLDDSNTQYADAQSEAESLDRNLNQLYAALRFLLPKAEFDKVKTAQIAWLKQRDAVSGIAAKNLLVRARIKSLQDLLWQSK